MKTKSIYDRLYRLIKPGTPAALAIVFGFWASLALAFYYVSGAMLGIESKSLGLLFLGLFGIFFVLHAVGPWSKSAAFLGFCSLAVTATFLAYLTSRFHVAFLASAGVVVPVMLLSAGLALAGVLLDAGKYFQWAAKASGYSLNVKDTILTEVRRLICSKNYDYSI